ncbi:MAG: precorrin-6y C5,15-methyltransferase (decarboxylating) subunit CbiE [Deltaproteobacteria bacterium]|nr:precorrin-6y C5,15-methyltransferase (decarboxylating) subunit CbiE [Deltaproteobacteria bacterium]
MKIIICGCGPGSPDYLAQAVHREVAGAAVLIGAQRLLDLFPASGAEKIPVGADIDGILRIIENCWRQQRVVVLVTGDPGISSLAQPVLNRFGRDACFLIPGISSVQVAFARLGLDWTDAKIIDAHGKNPEYDPDDLGKEKKLAILGGRQEASAWVQSCCRRWGDDYQLFCCENLTLPGERISEVTPEDLDSSALSSLTVFLLIRRDCL